MTELEELSACSKTGLKKKKRDVKNTMLYYSVLKTKKEILLFTKADKP